MTCNVERVCVWWMMRWIGWMVCLLFCGNFLKTDTTLIYRLLDQTGETERPTSTEQNTNNNHGYNYYTTLIVLYYWVMLTGAPGHWLSIQKKRNLLP